MLALLSQPPILKKEQAEQAEQKLSRQESWLLRTVALIGAVAGSQLALLAELYEQRLGGFISHSFSTLHESYLDYCKEEEMQKREPKRDILTPFAPCQSFMPKSWINLCEEKKASEVKEVTKKLIHLFNGADNSLGSIARVRQAQVWCKRTHMREQLDASGYTKPMYILLGGDVPLLKETLHNFQPGFLNWTSTLIYSVAGGVFAFGALYMTIQTAHWLHGAFFVQPSNPKKIND